MKKSKQYILLILLIAIVAAIDLSMAMKMSSHDPPFMLNPPEDVPPLLLFPPSTEDLAKLSGE